MNGPHIIYKGLQFMFCTLGVLRRSQTLSSTVFWYAMHLLFLKSHGRGLVDFLWESSLNC